MASQCRRFVTRKSLSSIKSNFRTAPATTDTSATSSFANFARSTKSSSSPARRFSFSRSPSELGCVQSLLPLHSAIAVARLTSRLSSMSSRALSHDEFDGT